YGCDRIRGVSGFPRQVLFARGIAERAPDRHRPLAWPLDSAVGVEAGFAGHFPRTLLVWIGAGHGLALGYCRLPTQPCVCFVKLKESFIVKKLGGCGRVSFGYEVEQLISAIHRAQPTGVIRVPVEGRLRVHADPRCLGQWKFTAFVVGEWPRGPAKDSRDKLAMNALEQQSKPPQSW